MICRKKLTEIIFVGATRYPCGRAELRVRKRRPKSYHLLTKPRTKQGHYLTVGEGIKQLSTLCVTEIKGEGKVLCSSIPEPRPELERIITTTRVIFPEVLKKQGAHVATKKKPPSRRKNR